MHRFEVWAPRAKRVTVVVDGERYPMKSEPRDWWAVDVERAGPGSRYGFLLDSTGKEGDEAPGPDPRSPWQPDGVHGLSTLIDHSSFRWTDQEWRPRTLG